MTSWGRLGKVNKSLEVNTFLGGPCHAPECYRFKEL